MEVSVGLLTHFLAEKATSQLVQYHAQYASNLSPRLYRCLYGVSHTQPRPACVAGVFCWLELAVGYVSGEPMQVVENTVGTVAATCCRSKLITDNQATFEVE